MKKRKKILIINTTFAKGGAAKVAYNIFNGIAEKSDFSLYFAYGRGKKINQKNVFHFGFLPENLLHVFITRFLGIEGWGTFFSTKRLINFIEKESFDLIHLHNLHGYYLNIWTLLTFLGRKNIPIIWTFHDEWPITYLPAYSIDCEHCKNLIGKCKNNYNYPKTYNLFFSKYLLKKKQKTIKTLQNLTIVCPSKWLKEQIEKSYLSEKEIRLIYNGIDTKIFNREKKHLKKELRKKYTISPEKKVLLFYCDQKDKRKGLEHVLKLAKIFINNPNFLFLGFGPTHIKKVKNIKTLGFIKNKEILKELYSLSDLLLYPSTAESFSLVVAESIMCGLPVVAFKIGPLPEIISKKFGLLVERDNLNLLKNGIEYLLQNLEKFQEIPDEEFVKRFSLENMIKNYLSLYQEKIK